MRYQIIVLFDFKPVKPLFWPKLCTLTSQIKEVLLLVFLRFCMSLRSLIPGTSFSFFPLLQVPSFILIMRRDTHILLLLFSVLHGHILYQSICKKGRRIRFWHSN